METEKRKRVSGEEEGNRNRGKRRETDGEANVAAPGDEEVEEFFAILRRIHVAVKYFQKRDGGRKSTTAPWSPAFERGDFAGVEKFTEKSVRDQNAGLDLNSYPASSDERDDVSVSHSL